MFNSHIILLILNHFHNYFNIYPYVYFEKYHTYIHTIMIKQCNKKNYSNPNREQSERKKFVVICTRFENARKK